MACVKDILSISELSQFSLVAGQKGLDNPLINIRVYEVHDAYKWMQQGDLIITTFMSVSPDKYEEVFYELYSKKIACIVLFCPELYCKDIPEKLIYLAEKYNLPLFVSPKDIAHVGIIYPLMQTIINSKVNTLEFTVKIVDEYNQILKKGGDFKDVVSFIHNSIELPVILLDQNFDSMCYLASTDEGYKMITSFLKNGLKTFYMVSERTLSQGHFIKYRYLKGNLFCYPISSQSEFLGCIIVFSIDEWQFEMNPIIEQGIIVLTVLFIPYYIDLYSKYTIKSEFLRLVLNGKTSEKDIQELKLLSEQLGIDINSGIHILLIRNINQNIKLPKLTINKLSKCIKEFCLEFWQSSVCIQKDNDFIIFTSEEVSYNNLKSSFKILMKSIKEINSTYELIIGVSPYICNFDNLYYGYHLTEKVLNLGPKINYEELNIYFASDLEHICYLDEIINQNIQLKTWAKKILQPVLDHDNEKQLPLLETCKVLLQSDNYQHAADKLFIHKNTLIYRKQLIDKLIGYDLYGSRRFIYTLAIYIFLITESE